MALLDDTEALQAQQARLNYLASQDEGLAPQEAQKKFKRARAIGVGVSVLDSMTPGEEASAKADKIDWNDMARMPAFNRAMGTPAFTSAIRDDVLNVGALEKFAWWVGEDPGTDVTGSLTGATRNAAARGIMDAHNILPGGNVSDAMYYSDRLRAMRKQKERLDAGESAKDVFADSEDPNAAAEALKANYAIWSARLEDQVRRSSAFISHRASTSALFAEGAETQAFHEAKGFKDAAKALFFEGNFIANMLNLAIPSLVQFIPTMGELALVGAASGGAGAVMRGGQMAVAWANSYGLDNAASMLSYIGEHGVNIYDANALSDYFLNGITYDEDKQKSSAHAMMTASFDAGSVGVAGFMLPRHMNASLTGRVPTMARIYENVMGNAYGRALSNFALQGQVQGAMGMAGEATGQLAAEGKITSYSDILAEGIGEHFMAPAEMAVATRGAYNLAKFNAGKSQAMQASVDRLAKAAQDSPVIQGAPEVVENYLADVENEHPEISKVTIDVSSMEQADVEAFKQEVPELAQRIDDARAEGGKLEMRYSEFVTKVAAKKERMDKVSGYIAVPDEVASVVEANEIVAGIEQTAKELSYNAPEGTTEEFKAGLKYVAGKVYSALEEGYGIKEVKQKDGTVKRIVEGSAERLAAGAIVMNHVSNMALETGVSPTKIWDEFGFDVLSEGRGDVVRNQDGSIGVISEKAKTALKSGENADSLSQSHAARTLKEDSVHFSSDLKKVFESKKVPGSGIRLLSRTPAILKLIANDGTSPRRVGDNGIFVSPHVFDNLFKEGRHLGITESVLRELPRALANPIAVFDPSERSSGAKKNRANGDLVFVVGIRDKNGATVVVPLMVSAKQKNRTEVSVVKSIYGKDQGNEKASPEEMDAMLADWVKKQIGVEKTARYVNGQFLASWLGMYPGPIPVMPYATNALGHTVHSVTELGKYKREHAGFYQEGEHTLGEFVPSSETIIRWAKADRSTLLHETGHWFLNARIALASRLQGRSDLTEAQKRFVDITEKAVQWASGKSLSEFSLLSVDEQRSAHEKFARTYEQYLKDGHAPTAALARVFARFSAWLKNIYGVLKSVPGSAMDPETQALFDELFTAGEQVREAEIRRSLFLGIKEAISEGGLNEANEDAVSEFIARRNAASKRYTTLRAATIGRLERYAKRMRRSFEADIRKEELQTSEGQAYAFFNTPVEVDGVGMTPRLSADELRRLGVSEEIIQKLVDKHIATKLKDAKQAVSAEWASEKFGYTSVDEMTQKLADYSPLTKEEVNALVQARMEEEVPEASTKEAIEESADNAIFNPSASRAVASELNWLLKAIGRDPVSAGLFETVAEATIRGSKWRDLKPSVFKSNAASAARRAKNALGAKPAGKNGVPAEDAAREAIQAKRQELYQMKLAQASQKALDSLKKRTDTLRKRFNGKAKIDGLPADYLAQIQSVLVRLGTCDKGVDSNTTWEAFLRDTANPNVMSDELLEARAQIGGFISADQTIDDLTVEEANTVLDFAETLDAIGRDSMKTEIEGKKIEVAERQKEAAEEILDTGRQDVGEFESSSGDERFLDIIGRYRRMVDASHSRIGVLFDRMCGRRFGKLSEYVLKPFEKARSKEADMKKKALDAMLKAFSPLKASVYNHHKKFYAELNASLTKSQIVSIALNLGNEENINRLVDGSDKYPFVKKNADGTKTKWTRDAVFKAVADTLTEEELRAIQSIWNTVSMYEEEAFAVEKRAGNRFATKVIAKPATFVLPSGKQVTLAGGYYPIAYDRKAGARAETINVAEEGLSALQGKLGRPSVRNNRLQSRASSGGGQPVSLTIRAGFEGLDETIHSICWRETIDYAVKFFDRNGAAYKAIRQKWGSDYAKAIEQWITDVAVPRSNANAGRWDRFASFVGQNVSLTSLGLNVVTAAVQIVGYTQTVAVLGGKWSLLGAAHAYAHPAEAMRFAQENSAVMRDRLSTQFRELTEVQAQFSGARLSDIRSKLMRFAYRPISAAQMLVDLPTWTGAYEKAISEGLSHEEAVFRADRTLIDAQGSGSAMDLSGIERGNAWQKLFTVFYTFFNAAYNIAVLSGNTKKGIERAADLLLVLVAQSVMETTMRAAFDGLGGDDDWMDKLTLENYCAEVASFNLGLIMMVREASQVPKVLVGESTFGYSGPTSMKLPNDLDRLAQQVARGELDEGLARACVSVLSDVIGLPATAVNRAIKAYANGGNGWSYLFGYKGK